METKLNVREATPADIDGIAGAAGRAFAEDDPFFDWLLGGDQATRARKLTALIRLELRHQWNPDKGRVFTMEDTPGAALWFSPGNWKMPLTTTLRVLPGMLRLFGPRAFVRGVKFLTTVEKLHPREEHWYLQMLATDPPMQRKGVASALLAPILEQCDADGLPAYLETQKLANVAFYRRHGFEVRQEIEVTKGSPHVWLMWREPR